MDGVIGEKLRSRFEEAIARVESGEVIAADEACSYFSDLLEAQGQAPGSNLVVSYLPDQDSAIAVSGQTCVAGTFASLLVGRMDLADEPDIASQVREVLTGLT